LAISASPVVSWFQKKGVPSMASFSITMLIIVVFVLAIVWLISASLQEFVITLPAYSQQLSGLEENANQILADMGLSIDGLTSSETIVTPEGAMQLVANFASELISGLSNWALILIMSIFFLLEATNMPRKLRNVTEESDPDVQRVIRFNQDVREFVSITAIGGLITAVLDIILLLVVGVEFALLWGVFAFFMSFVPSIGILLAMIPPAIMALVQFGFTEMLIVVIGFVVIDQIVTNVLKRPYMQKKLNISLLMIFISLVVWGWVFGPIGAILAVPMAMLVKAILNSRDETKWLAYLMGDGQEPFKMDSETHQDSS